MLKVEKKKRFGGKKRVWLLLPALLLIAGSLFLFLRAQRPEEEKPVRQVTGGTIVMRDPDSIVRLSVKLRNREAWTAVRDEASGKLRLEGETAWTVDEALGDLMLDAAAHLSYGEVLTDDPAVYRDRLEEFGLDPAQAEVECAFADGTVLSFRIGDEEEGEENRHYLTVEGDRRLMTVSSGTLRDLAVEKELLHPVEQPGIIKALTDRITLRESGEPVKEWRLRGNPAAPDAGTNWLVTAPFEYPADEETVGRLLECSEELRLGTYVGDAEPELLAACGIGEAARELEIHMAAGSTGTVTENGVYDVREWPERTVTLRLGPDGSDMTIYAAYENAVYTVSRFTVSPLLDVQPEATAARYPVLTPFDSLSGLTVEGEGRTDVYSIERGEPGAAEADPVRCLKNGEDISAEAFEAAYQRLLVVTFTGMLPEDAAWGKPEKKYTFRTVNGETHTVALSPCDALHDAVTVDGYTRFYLIRGGMTELP